MGGIGDDELRELEERANARGDGVLDAAIRAHIFGSSIQWELNQFLEAHGAEIIKGALGLDGCCANSDRDPLKQLASMWDTLKCLREASEELLALLAADGRRKGRARRPLSIRSRSLAGAPRDRIKGDIPSRS